MVDTIEMKRATIVIPTLNCSEVLRHCLNCVLSQDRSQELSIMVVDGGSTDDTLDVAMKAGAEIFVNPGQYGTGHNGARHFGELRAQTPYLWYLDSDNFLVERNVAGQLLDALDSNPSVNLAVPITLPSPEHSSFNNWLSLREKIRLMEEISRGDKVGGLTLVDDLSYGITNGTMVRTDVALSCGGYDSDVRLLLRLRRRHMARAVILENAHIYHQQVESPIAFMQKLSRRIARIGGFSDRELTGFFVEYPVPDSSHKRLTTEEALSVLTAPLEGLQQWARTGDITWLWGVCYPFLFGLPTILHPFKAKRIYSRFL